MSKFGMAPHDQTRAALMGYINRLLNDGEPFAFSMCGEHLHRSETWLKEHLRRLEHDGVLRLESRHNHAIRRYRIVMADGRSTSWPVSGDVAVKKPGEAEILTLRLETEQRHAARRRYWLDRERAPRARDQPRDFMDKATMLALQGGAA
jgi:hypothetical protein